MSVRKIITLEDEKKYFLRRRAPKVTKFDKWLVALARDMAETMYAEGGSGLAAPQVGQSIRLIVVRGQQEKFVALVNPEITGRTGAEIKGHEGCLSIPGYLALDVPRIERVHISTKNLLGHAYSFWTEGYPARILQHEIDHLNGILMIDHVPPEQVKRMPPMSKITHTPPED